MKCEVLINHRLMLSFGFWYHVSLNPEWLCFTFYATWLITSMDDMILLECRIEDTYVKKQGSQTHLQSNNMIELFCEPLSEQVTP